MTLSFVEKFRLRDAEPPHMSLSRTYKLASCGRMLHYYFLYPASLFAVLVSQIVAPNYTVFYDDCTTYMRAPISLLCLSLRHDNILILYI